MINKDNKYLELNWHWKYFAWHKISSLDNQAQVSVFSPHKSTTCLQYSGHVTAWPIEFQDDESITAWLNHENKNLSSVFCIHLVMLLAQKPLNLIKNIQKKEQIFLTSTYFDLKLVNYD